MPKGAYFRTKYLLLILMIVIIVTIYYYDKENRKRYVLQLLKPSNISRIKQQGTFCLESLDIQLRQCLVAFFKRSQRTVWASLVDGVNACCKVLRKSLPILSLENKDDVKYVILSSRKTEPCFVLTVGIGDDITAERRLKSLKPNCRFLGVDPVYKSGYAYSRIGQYLQMAVSDSDGKWINGQVLIEGRYVDKRLKSVDFFSLLNSTGTGVIDYLFFDAEGAEYWILPLLTKSRFGVAGIRICQISIELHGLDRRYVNASVERFNAMILDLLENSVYVPVLSDERGFVRMFWIDFQSTECVSKYLPNYCAENFDRFDFRNYTELS